MSSYHIGYAYGQDGKYRLAVEFHIPVPQEDNALTGEVNYLRTNLINDTEYPKASTFADAGELTQIGNGEIAVVVHAVKSNNNKTNAEIRTQVRALYDQLAIDVLDDLRRRYKAIGYAEVKGVDF